MRRLLLGLAVVLALVFLAFAVEMIAAENGEVVVLRTSDDAGALQETRLWVVDEGGRPWLRAGHEGAGWFRRLRARPDVEIVRGDETLAVRAIPDPTAAARVNARMAEKYGWADAYIGTLFSREGAIPVRLDPR